MVTLLRQRHWRIAGRDGGGKRAAAWFAAVIVVPFAAHAQALLDPASVPGLDAAGRASYADWLLTNTPRAVAVGSNGRIGWFSGRSLAAARAGAVSLCAEHGGTACQLYAEDLDIVWPGRAVAAAKPPGPFVDTINYGFIPDERFLWHGPAAAAGVIVWSHGKGAVDADGRDVQPPPFLRAFNNAGWDIVRFDRAPRVDTVPRAAGWLRDGLAMIRRQGYRRVVAAGGSRGGWTSLQMLDVAGLADAVIAISPAAHGEGQGTNALDNEGAAAGSNLLAQDDDLRAILAAADAAPARVAVAQFAGDPFVSDEDAWARQLSRLRPRVAALLLIDRPPGFSGHMAGMGQAFARHFAACLLRFVQDPQPPSACP